MGFIGRASHLTLALVPLALGGWWALRYPIGGVLAPVLFGAMVMAFAVSGRWWLTLLLALLPIAGYTDWTGWILVEEGDFLVWACMAGWCLRRVWSPVDRAQHGGGLQWGWPLIAWALLGFSALASLLMHVLVWEFDPAANYHAPQAALRMVKPYLWIPVLVAMLAADWRASDGVARQHLNRSLGWGMAAGLAVGSAVVVTERWVNTGLLNFSSDYRATGPFWEMHVGGAALDAFLAASLPFAVLMMRGQAIGSLWVAAASCVALGVYAVVVTFSRGAYAAALLGLLLSGLVLMASARGPRTGDAGGLQQGISAVVTLVMAAMIGGAVIFAVGGYRGGAAWIGVVALLPITVSQVRQHDLRQEFSGNWVAWMIVTLGAGLGIGLSLIGSAVPKGVYGAYGLLLIALLGMIVWHLRQAALIAALLGWFVWGALLAASAAVSLHWGEGKWPSTVAVVHVGLAVLGLYTLHRSRPLWPQAISWHVNTAMALAVLPLLLGSVLGGVYMQSRVSTTGQDLDNRMSHWESGLALLRSEDERLWGKGLARFPQEYQLAMPPRSDMPRPGHHAVRLLQGQPTLVLIGADPSMGSGEQYRVIQRAPSIAGASGPFTLVGKVRAPERSATLSVELCGRHLLYPESCLVGSLRIERQVAQSVVPDENAAPVWAPVRIVLEGGMPSWPSGLLAPRPVLALMTTSGSAPLWLTDLQLLDGQGWNHLHNGSFERGLERWFFTSDRSHLPWSAKNVVVHLLVEQGWFGLWVWVAVWMAAWLKALLGGLRGSLTQAALAGSLLGLMVVGGVDSLLNHTRVLGLLMLLQLWSLALPISPSRGSPRVSRREAQGTVGEPRLT